MRADSGPLTCTVGAVSRSFFAIGLDVGLAGGVRAARYCDTVQRRQIPRGERKHNVLTGPDVGYKEAAVQRRNRHVRLAVSAGRFVHTQTQFA